ncbi:MAG TPA: DUF4331 family protein [Xanthomonadales bacterium]|nr:DUF4331 family protein [Xanthomonadales bacterium]
MNTKYSALCAPLLLTAAMASTAFAADHLDAPLVQNDPASDINDIYTFVNPNDTDELILVMTVNPIANSATRFSDVVAYRFNIGNADGEESITCTFTRPDETFLSQDVNCIAPGGRSVSGAIGATRQNGDMRVYAGLRDDPFFFDLQAFNDTVASQAPAFTDPGTDFFAGLNTLAIVVGIDNSVFAPAAGGDIVLSVWGDTIRNQGGGINAGISGSWFGEDPDQDGHGFQIEVLDRPANGPYENDVLAYWYNYVGGQQIFLLGEGRAVGGGVEIPVIITSGAEFGNNFSADDVIRESAGILTLIFSDCDSGIASFEADYPGLSDFDFPIQRLSRIKDLPCSYLQEGQIDRQGRPAVNTALIGSARKDDYNLADDPTTWADMFQAEMAAALDFVDGLDGVAGNALLGDSTTLASVLVNDRIVIRANASVCGPYLAVELGDTENCGGRTLDADVMDATLDALVAFGAGVSDGVDANDKPFLADFPFLAEPNQ